MLSIIPLIEKENLSAVNVLRTYTEHVALQMVSVFDKYKLKIVFVSGGGVFNSFLLGRMNQISTHISFKTDPQLVESKEAMAFAFLGLMKMNNQINVLSSVTGSVKDHSSGTIYPEEL